MTTSPWAFMNVPRRSSAIHIKGGPKSAVVVDEDYRYKNAKFVNEMHQQERQRSLELSKENPLRQKAAQAEAAMSEELMKLKQNEFLDHKRRQKLRNDCSELRELAEQLRLASITQDLEEHLSELRHTRQRAKNAQALSFQRAERERLDVLVKEHEKEMLRKEQQKKLHESLLLQIEETRKRQQKFCVERVAEREKSIALQQQIEEEEKAEQLKQEQIKSMKLKEMLDFIEQRKEYKALQRAQSDENIAKVLETQQERAERDQEMELAKQEGIRKQQEIGFKIGQQVFEIESRKRQRENLLLDLLQAEYKAKNDEHYRQQLKQEQEERWRARQELLHYRAEVAERSIYEARLKQEQKCEKIIDTIDIKQGENEYQEDRRRRKMYGDALLSMIEENHRKRAEAAAENVQFFDTKNKLENKLQVQIQEERLQMLNSVPTSIIKYLPKKVLSNSEREYFNIQAKPRAEKVKPQDHLKLA